MSGSRGAAPLRGSVNTGIHGEYRFIVRIERLRIQGLVDTLTSQAPEVARGIEVLAE